MRATKIISIRPARAEDAAVLCRAEQVTSRTPGRLISAPDELEESAFREKIVRLSAPAMRDTADTMGTADTAGLYAVAEIDGQLAAHALLEPGALRALSHVFALTIVVHPGQTGRGVGTALMTYLLDWAARTSAVEKIELRVREGNLGAQRLYAQFGFIEEGRFRNRIKLDDGSYLADIAMARFIDH